jgi:hypothetical protein
MDSVAERRMGNTELLNPTSRSLPETFLIRTVCGVVMSPTFTVSGEVPTEMLSDEKVDSYAVRCTLEEVLSPLPKWKIETEVWIVLMGRLYYRWDITGLTVKGQGLRVTGR